MLTLSVYALSALSMGLLVLRIVYRPASRTPGDILRGAVGGATLFVLLGPLIATLVLTLFKISAGINAQDLPLVMVFLPLAYISGCVPALLSGLVVGAWRPDRASWWSYGWAGLLAALYCFVFMRHLLATHETWPHAGLPLTASVAAALVGGAVCARVFYGQPSPPGPTATA